MQTRLVILIMLFSLFGLTNCEKKCGFGEINGDVDLFLIKTYDNLDQSCQIDDSSVVLEAEALIKYDQIKTYDESEHLFYLNDDGLEMLADTEWPVDGVPFAIVADGLLIYTAYFWPAYSSLSCNWYTTDPLLIEANEGFRIQLGYPGGGSQTIEPDLRNDERILSIFRRDGKLK